VADAAAKLERARGLLRRAEDRAVRARPAPEVDERVLPVAAPLARLLPASGLRRGTTVAVAPGPAATSLLWAALAAASADGAWVGIVGRPDLGLVAAAEAGMRLERLALVPRPGAELLAVTAVLLDGLDVVVMAGSQPVQAGERQRLAARARQRGSVLVPLGRWPGADVLLTCADARWRGVGVGQDGGVGRLDERRVVVRVLGRGVAQAGLVERLLMPVRPASPVVAAPPAPVPVSPVPVSPVPAAPTSVTPVPAAATPAGDALAPAAALATVAPDPETPEPGAVPAAVRLAG
jgi:hypothetical protein